MQLTPMLKTLVIGLYVLIQVAGWIWVGIKVDLLALNFNENIYNIGVVILSSFNTAVGGIVVYLGLKAPVMGEEVRQIEP